MSTTEELIGRAFVVTEDNTAGWLDIKKSYLGSSEAAAALGVHDIDTPLDIWQRKLGLAPPVVENEAMYWGKELEPAIARAYTRRTGRQIVGSQLCFTDERYPWAIATIDGLADDGRIVEIKTTSAWAKGWGEEESDQAPEPYIVQVHHQMLLTDAVQADIAVLIGGQRFRIYSVPRNEELIAALIDGERDFWSCVERQVPPTTGRLTARALAILNPDCQGERDLGPETERAATYFERCNALIKRLEERRERAKMEVLAAMGGAKLGHLPSGRTVKRFLQDVPAREVSYTSKAYQKHYFNVSES